MTWLLLLVLSLGALLWWGVRPRYCVGVLATLLLLYGRYGDSVGGFLLGVLLFAAIALPLLIDPIRQDWLSRPLLDSLTPRLPRAHPQDPCIAAWLSHPAPQTLPRATAADLIALLQGWFAAQPSPYAANSHSAQRGARDYRRWRLGPEPADLHTLPAPAWAAALARARSPAWLESAHDERLWRALLGFDRHFYPWAFAGLQVGVRGWVMAITAGQVRHGAARTEPATLALSRFRGQALRDIALLISLWGGDETREHLWEAWAGPLADAITAESRAERLQTLLVAEPDGADTALLQLALGQCLLRAEAAQWAIVQRVRRPLRRWLLTAWLFPLGRRQPPSPWALEQDACHALVDPLLPCWRPEAVADDIRAIAAADLIAKLAQHRPALAQLVQAAGSGPWTDAQRKAVETQGFADAELLRVVDAARGFLDTAPTAHPERATSETIC